VRAIGLCECEFVINTIDIVHDRASQNARISLLSRLRASVDEDAISQATAAATVRARRQSAGMLMVGRNVSSVDKYEVNRKPANASATEIRRRNCTAVMLVVPSCGFLQGPYPAMKRMGWRTAPTGHFRINRAPSTIMIMRKYQEHRERRSSSGIDCSGIRERVAMIGCHQYGRLAFYRRALAQPFRQLPIRGFVRGLPGRHGRKLVKRPPA
jgi:hypothetical protein